MTITTIPPGDLKTTPAITFGAVFEMQPGTGRDATAAAWWRALTGDELAADVLETLYRAELERRVILAQRARGQRDYWRLP